MNRKGYDIINGKRVYYDDILTTAYCKENGKRKYYLLKQFALASCNAYLGYDRKVNPKYRKHFAKKHNVVGSRIHHEIDGRIYLVPNEWHKIPHCGYVSLLKKSKKDT